MDWFVLVLPQIIAGLMVAAIGGLVAWVFNSWRRQRRIAQLRQVEAECWDVLKMQEDMRKFLQDILDAAPDKSAGEFISERIKILESSMKPVVIRRDQAREELFKLQSGLAD